MGQGWKSTWPAQESPNHQLFQNRKVRSWGWGRPRALLPPPGRDQHPHRPQCSARPAQARNRHIIPPEPAGRSHPLPPGATSSPGQGDPPAEGRSGGTLRFPGRPPAPAPGEASAARLFLGVEGEGNEKRDRELGRGGREVRERVFAAAIASIKSGCRYLKPFLPEPFKSGPDGERANSSIVGSPTCGLQEGGTRCRRRRGEGSQRAGRSRGSCTGRRRGGERCGPQPRG